MKKKMYLLFVMLLLSSICIGQRIQSVDSLIRIGTVEIYDNPEKAIKLGMKIASDSLYDVDSRVKALLMISNAYSSKRDYQSSLAYALKAKSLVPKTNNQLIHISVFDRIAVQYHQLGIFDKAIKALNESEKMCFKYPIKDSVYASLGINYAIRGFIYREQLNCEIALGYFNRSLSEFEKASTISANSNQSIVIYNKANCYVLLGDYQQAKAHFLESIALADKGGAQSLKAFSLKGFAEVLTLEGSYNKAIETLKEAQEISEQVGDLILNRELYRGFSNNYLAINDLEKYQLYNKKFLDLNLQIKESERGSVSNSIENSHLSFKMAFEQKKTQYLYMILGVIILMFLILLFLFFRRKTTREKTKSLLSQIQMLQK